MKARVVAWNGPYQEYKGDPGFRTLNDCKYGQTREIEEPTAAIAEVMEQEFNKMYPDFEYNHMQIITEQNELE